MTNNVAITNSNGRFYAGMTLKDARERGVDKCVFRRDFYNVDKNHDGVLSAQEIMAEREYDANAEKWTAICFGTLGFLDFFTPSGKWEKVLGLGIDALLIAFSLNNYNKIKKKSAEYEKILAQQGNRTFNA